jgi:hypothetical protein
MPEKGNACFSACAGLGENAAWQCRGIVASASMVFRVAMISTRILRLKNERCL